MTPRPAVAAPGPRRRTLDAENPWPGLEAFHERDRRFFRGREGETERLLRMVERSRVTLLFGKSGLGKTSLLQAGLFPRLRRADVLPVYVRPNLAAGSPPVRAQILAAVAFEAQASGAEAPPIREGDTLWEYFHRVGADFWSARNRPLVPLLAFDQFEEIFTLGGQRPEEIGAFVGELEELAEGHPPAAVKREVDRAPARAREFTFSRHPYKLVVSLREDFLPELESFYPRIPALITNRLRLQRMSGEAALEVVTQAEGLVTPEVAARIVRFVAAGEAEEGEPPLAELEVEPALLSVVCRGLNERRVARGEPRITADLLVGSQAEILSDLYEESLADVDAATRAFLEESLLTASGFRDSVALENALAVPGVELETVQRLVDRRLIRVEDYGGVPRIELTHDLLTGVVAASRDRRRRREEREQAEAARLEAERREREARRKLRRSRATAAVLFLMFLLAVAGAIWGWVGQRQAQRAEGRASQARDAAEAARMQEEAARKQAESEGQAADRAREQESQARDAAERAQGEAEAERLAAVRAEEQERQARAAAESAQEETERQRLAAVLAEDQERQAREAAEFESRRAVAAEREGCRLRMLSVAQELAARATLLEQEGEEELSAKLALEAYGLNDHFGGDPQTPEIHAALRLGLERIEPDGSRVYRQAAPIRALAVAAESGKVAAGDEKGRVLLLELESGGGEPAGLAFRTPPRLVGRLESPVRALALDATGTRLAAGGLDGEHRVWSLEAPEGPPVEGGGGMSRVLGLAFRPKGRELALASPEGLWLWDPEPGSGAARRVHAAPAESVAFAPSGDRLAVAGPGGALLLAADGSAPVPVGPCGEDVRAVALDPAGSRLACGAGSGSIVVASADGADPVRIGDHMTAVTALAFGPGGSRLASAGLDGTARVWELGAGSASRAVALPDHRRWVWAVGFLAEGRGLASAGADGAVRLWHVKSADLAAEIGPRVAELTAEERRQHLPADLVSPRPLGELCAAVGLEGEMP